MRMNKNTKSLFEDVDLTIIPDIKDIHIDPLLPIEKRIEKYIKQNPYPEILKIGDYHVKCSYREGAGRLENRLDEYFNYLAGKQY